MPANSRWDLIRRLRVKPELINAGVGIHVLCFQHCLMQCRYYDRCTFPFFTALRPSNSKSQPKKNRTLTLKCSEHVTWLLVSLILGIFFIDNPQGRECESSDIISVWRAPTFLTFLQPKKLLLLRAQSACDIVLKCNSCNARRHKS